MTHPIVEMLLASGNYFHNEAEAAAIAFSVLDHSQPDTQQALMVRTDTTGLCPHCTLLIISRLGSDLHGTLHEIGCPVETDTNEGDRVAASITARTGVTTVRPRDKAALLHVRRNDECPCGSGRKFKRCCGQ